MKEDEKMFLAYDPTRQDEIDSVVRFLKDSGMKDEDIKKVGYNSGLFYYNDNYVTEDSKNIKM